jgi:hypothetical protein
MDVLNESVEGKGVRRGRALILDPVEIDTEI